VVRGKISSYGKVPENISHPTFTKSSARTVRRKKRINFAPFLLPAQNPDSFRLVVLNLTEIPVSPYPAFDAPFAKIFFPK
jgi:hypothetical protein